MKKPEKSVPLDDIQISVKQGDVLSFPCNVLVLKYAQTWHGADLEVSHRLGIGRGWSLGGDFVAPGQCRLVSTDRKIKADAVLFEGVLPLQQFNYARIREFGRSSLLHLNEELPDVRHVAMTIHGVNVGMDERECFLSQLAGVLEALEKPGVLGKIEEISFVEKNGARAERLVQVLQQSYSARRKANTVARPLAFPLANAGLENKEKPHIFVAMPFSTEMEDVFIFGVQGPVQEAGFLCERVDMDIFTGDIVDRIKSRIESARLLIADLSGANANVYLEVGYAWGRKVTTVLLCRDVNDLKFDVKGQRCLVYSSINDLRKKLSEELSSLLK